MPRRKKEKNTLKTVEKCYFYSISTAFYSIKSKFFEPSFFILLQNIILSIPKDKSIGFSDLMFHFGRPKPPTLQDSKKTWRSYEKCVHTLGHVITKMLIFPERLEQWSWNFELVHRISCSFRPYLMAGPLVSCDWSNHRDTQRDMSVTGCEHISHSTFKILYLRSEKWGSHEIWHEHPHMILLNGQKRKSFEILSNEPFFLV